MTGIVFSENRCTPTTQFNIEELMAQLMVTHRRQRHYAVSLNNTLYPLLSTGSTQEFLPISLKYC